MKYSSYTDNNGNKKCDREIHQRKMEEQFWREIGIVQDRVESFARNYLRDGGVMLHSNIHRYQTYVKYLCQFTGSKIARNEAFTVLLQKLCSSVDFNNYVSGKQKEADNLTKRHVDGPNDFRTGYRHTFVLSTL